jgi:hypothetical protein
MLVPASSTNPFVRDIQISCDGKEGSQLDATITVY